MIWLWSWYLNWLQNANTLKLGCPFFSHFIEWHWRPLSLKCWHLEAREDIITKFKSESLHIIGIKYWKASGSGNPPFLIPALWNRGILLHKTKFSILLYIILHTTVCIYKKRQTKVFGVQKSISCVTTFIKELLLDNTFS